MADLHDLGGKREFYGPIVRSESEVPFHADWERRIFGINNFLHSLVGLRTDEFRGHLVELPPEEYFGPYYGRWVGGVERTFDDVISGARSLPKVQVAGTSRVVGAMSGRKTLPKIVNTQVLPRLTGTGKRAKQVPEFSVGDSVRVRPRISGHTQQPGYVSGKLGRIAAHQGAATFPDAVVNEGVKAPEHLYTVAFDGTELWGPDAEPNTEILVELFEPHLEQP